MSKLNLNSNESMHDVPQSVILLYLFAVEDSVFAMTSFPRVNIARKSGKLSLRIVPLMPASDMIPLHPITSLSENPNRLLIINPKEQVVLLCCTTTDASIMGRVFVLSCPTRKE